MATTTIYLSVDSDPYNPGWVRRIEAEDGTFVETTPLTLWEAVEAGDRLQVLEQTAEAVDEFCRWAEQWCEPGRSCQLADELEELRHELLTRDEIDWAAYEAAGGDIPALIREAERAGDWVMVQRAEERLRQKGAVR